MDILAYVILVLTGVAFFVGFMTVLFESLFMRCAIVALAIVSSVAWAVERVML